jgi:branched-chain amino acid transport system ATP-binding protein
VTDLLVLEGLTKRYGRFVAVDGVDLTLPEGRLSSIIGPNGAGKTTLINAVTGLVRADGGRVVLAGEDITRLPTHTRVRRGISRSFQITSVFRQLTVLENVLVPVLARGGRSARPLRALDADADARAEAEELLDAVGLRDAAGRVAGELSHGDQRLVEVAMALAPRPRLCLLDEPAAGANPAERQQIIGLVRRLADEWSTTFVVVEHDMDVVFSISQWIVVLARGTVLAEGPPEAIRADRDVQEVYLGEVAG